MTTSKTGDNRPCCAPSITCQDVNEKARRLGKAPSLPGPVGADDGAAEPFPNNKEMKDFCSLMLQHFELDFFKNHNIQIEVVVYVKPVKHWRT